VSAGVDAARLTSRLRDVVGARHVLDDPDVVAGFVTDFTRRFRGATPAVVRPGSTAEVAAVIRVCRELGAALVPQGGNTGLVGGSVPLHGEVVLSLQRLAGVTGVDATAGQLTAGAGTTVAVVQAAAAEAGWAYGVDLGSRGTATAGGTVATNAGGLRVLRHGDTRRQLVGVEAVLGTGAVVSHLGGLRKDNTGYHLPGLLCGSEGTLGVVTAAVFDLVPPTPARVVALLAFDAAAAALEALGPLRRGLPSLAAAELFFDDGLALVCSVTGAPRPFDRPHAAYLLVEAAGIADPSEDLAAAAGSLAGVADAAVAWDPGRVAALWHYREAHTEAINSLGVPHKLDVTLPAGELAEFVARVGAAVSGVRDGARVWLFGHAGDGNIHVNVTGVAPDDERVDAAVFGLAAGMGGSISAEHGIGAAKRRWLHLNRSAAEIGAFRALKRALDPDGVLNPHVLLPD
jgi:FAD/FMN-containing dehydrogenase